MEAHLRYCGQHDVSSTLPNVVNLAFEEVDFGRGSNNRVVLDTSEEIVVSRKHASIVRYTRRIQSADGCSVVGTWKIRDHGSRNGTFVNYVRVMEKSLQFGDIIHFGGGTRAPVDGFPVAGISSQFIFVFLEGLPPGRPSDWEKLPRLEHVPSTPMGVMQRANFLFRQGLGMSLTDHAREEASMSRLLDDRLECPSSGAVAPDNAVPAMHMSPYHPAMAYSPWTAPGYPFPPPSYIGYLPMQGAYFSRPAAAEACVQASCASPRPQVHSAPSVMQVHGGKGQTCSMGFEPLSAGGEAMGARSEGIHTSTFDQPSYRVPKRPRDEFDNQVAHGSTPVSRMFSDFREQLATGPADTAFQAVAPQSIRAATHSSRSRPVVRWSSRPGRSRSPPAKVLPDQEGSTSDSTQFSSLNAASPRQPQLLESVKQIANCGICDQWMVDAVTTPCGHSFCNLCISRHFIRSTLQSCNCPHCHEPVAPSGVRVLPQQHVARIRQSALEAGVTPPQIVAVEGLLTRNLALRELVSAMVATSTLNAKEAFEARIRQHSHEVRVLGVDAPSHLSTSCKPSEDDQVKTEEACARGCSESDSDSDSSEHASAPDQTGEQRASSPSSEGLEEDDDSEMFDSDFF